MNVVHKSVQCHSAGKTYWSVETTS